MFTDKIDKYCREHGMTRNQFERKADIAGGAIMKWKLGTCRPTLRSLEKIEAYTGIPIGEWLAPDENTKATKKKP